MWRIAQSSCSERSGSPLCWFFMVQPVAMIFLNIVNTEVACESQKGGSCEGEVAGGHCEGCEGEVGGGSCEEGCEGEVGAAIGNTRWLSLLQEDKCNDSMPLMGVCASAIPNGGGRNNAWLPDKLCAAATPLHLTFDPRTCFV